ncbi:expressed unknown protein [Seminavis robusta]|uniref:Uncharacterized protein n=1 Tax=Seminavis robusta TaxID=568900 RepID=A0A9N8HQI4_9STRA|nr:expressed unknown protein [Seminavis robusta]|eukprot:Sro1196_g251490.1 n/a (198) ;mRNA; r:20138-20731
MKDLSNSIAANKPSITPLCHKDSSFAGLATLDELRSKARDMFHLPPMDKKQSVLDELFQFSSSVDYCDNEHQVEVLRHHYINEFGSSDTDSSTTEEEVLKDYLDDSVIHKVVDDLPSTYRGKSGAVHAWHDLAAVMKGPCTFDLTHVSVCRNHAQVNWKAECSKPNRRTIFGTDSFTFDDSNHIKMQTTVALSNQET